MKVVRLTIKNFRGIASASLFFKGHTLLIGANNVGKSTVCEALELALGPDKLKKFPPVQEFDFNNAKYVTRTEDKLLPSPIEIEAVLTELSDELELKCVERLEFWHKKEERVLAEGEADAVDKEEMQPCLRIKTIAFYNADEDEFEAKSVFCGGQPKADGEPYEIPRSIKQLFGFFYLRALRTGSRALSLERGSLLDVILQRRNVRTGIWENAIQQLRELKPPIDEGAVNLTPILENIEKRIQHYIPLASGNRATHLYVSQLTREHLRKTISFFMKTSTEQAPVPFQELGTGTLNTLVFALLSLIAEIKKDNVIFAMEEPEIALPPHTQRRIIKYLLENTTQSFVTSHSPYVIERFKPEQIQILRKDDAAVLKTTSLPSNGVLKIKTYRRHTRKGIAEAMLGRGVIIGEGLTEREIIQAISEKMEENNPDECYPLDLSGISILSADGDGSLSEFGAFFNALDIKAFAIYDAKTRTPQEEDKLRKNFFCSYQINYKGAEKMIAEEVPIDVQWVFLQELRNDEGETDRIPEKKPDEKTIKELTYSFLKNKKGDRYAAHLVELCAVQQLPKTLLDFMKKVYGEFKKPEPLPALQDAQDAELEHTQTPSENPEVENESK